MENFDLDVQVVQVNTPQLRPGVTQDSCAFVCY
ncbi:hypothetical protein EV586_104399 [Tumebacillus sp. BK434]|nr:hypothetical protein EV586_104399 [Tumebacillus sp. BK434]